MKSKKISKFDVVVFKCDTPWEGYLGNSIHINVDWLRTDENTTVNSICCTLPQTVARELMNKIKKNLEK